MSRHRTCVALAALLAIVATAPLASPVTAAAPAGLSRLVEVRAAHHPGLNRVVLQFDGGLPELSALHRATSPPTLEPSGLPSHVHGNAFVTAVFQGATGNRTTPPYGTT